MDRAMAEKAKCDPVCFKIWGGEGLPRGQWNMRADDRVAAVNLIFLVEKMHRTAEPLGTARCLSEKFSHARIRTRAAREGVPVIAIGSDDVIVISHGRDCTGDHRFLSNVKIAEAADLPSLILHGRGFLETPDHQHQH